ncbi:MAG: Fe(3+) ABC transporter substrate-binding protein [Pseudomonadota bacterium]|nr:Fe(3+) ABC transporter substrate-binding protein [Pseudomonadota bacterium]
MIDRKIVKSRSVFRHIALAALVTGVAFACARSGDKDTTGATAAKQAGEVNVYSGRHYDSDLDIFRRFEGETGIKVNYIEAGGDELIERLAREGAASPADMFITADAGILWRAEERDLFRPITSPAILDRVPSQYRQPEGDWVGLAKRARVIIYNKAMGLPEGLETYEDLARPEYKGMICVRSSSNVYNQSLLASIIANDGAEAAESWARGVVANFARRPEGTDTTQIEAVAAGICRLGIVNSYYVARYLNPDDAARLAIGEKIGVLFPNQSTTGTHVNVSGAGVTAHAPNAQNAERLIEFLLRDDIQKAFAKGNNEYPVVPGIDPEGPITTLGTFRADTLDVAAYGRNQAEAVRIFDRAGWP